MMNRRQMIDQLPVDLDYLYKLMRSLFPKQNDCASLADLAETIDELTTFSITTRRELRLLLKRHRQTLLDIDKTPLDAKHQKLYREDLGDDVYYDLIRRQCWFCYPALVRLALELEFGDRYETFAEQRDSAYISTL